MVSWGEFLLGVLVSNYFGNNIECSLKHSMVLFVQLLHKIRNVRFTVRGKRYKVNNPHSTPPRPPPPTPHSPTPSRELYIRPPRPSE